MCAYYCTVKDPSVACSAITLKPNFIHDPNQIMFDELSGGFVHGGHLLKSDVPSEHSVLIIVSGSNEQICGDKANA